ncbi:hypothetical protein YQ44_05005 [Janthinobacterium sp. 1_2014MBL_MicDiv]|nr:hypothetical protein YQ44_05005 [Janthinobacterium sp. 1_2014MBL_MicDiv]
MQITRRGHHDTEHSMRLDKFLPAALVTYLQSKQRAAFYRYALVAALMAVVCIIGLLALGESP